MTEAVVATRETRSAARPRNAPAETVARQSAMKGPGASPKFRSAIAPIIASTATNDVARQRKGMRR
ncbi:MAG TPA: hypothetical protein DEF51_30180 [Myxococcales bacterium]|nr:hypothetical protein [Myxococcales bacterium]